MTGRPPRRPGRDGRRLVLVPDPSGPTTLPARTGAPTHSTAPTSGAAPTSDAAPARGGATAPQQRRDGSSGRETPAEPVPALLRELLGARLRRARAAQGRSLRDVGAAAGVSPGHLSQVERGLAEASSEVLAALCRSLGVPLHVLLRAVAVDLTAGAEPATSDRAVTSLTSVGPTSASSSAPRPGSRVRSGGGVRLAA